MADATHIAFSDESNHTTGRFRGIGMVSMPAEEHYPLLYKVDRILRESSVTEFKWSKMKGVKYRFLAMNFIDLLIAEACQKKLRIDVIIWDTEDRRHKIFGRDDKANLQKMYLYLFRTSLKKRWPSSATWKLFPDENSAIDWRKLQYRLDKFAKYRDPEYLEAAFGRLLRISGVETLNETWNSILGDFSVLEISEVNSANAPLAQVADLFAGVGVFSHLYYKTYSDWKVKKSQQMSLRICEPLKEDFSSKENEHCYVLDYLNNKCKHYRLQVALRTTRGLFTHNPSKPINFWLYRPQSDYDKAPIRRVTFPQEKVS